VPVPHFSECQHPILQSLHHHTDEELVSLFQHHPNQGKYFVAIFCRYHAVTYQLIRQAVRSPVQCDYLFSLIWKQVYRELKELTIAELLHQEPKKSTSERPTSERPTPGSPNDSLSPSPQAAANTGLEAWLVNTATDAIQQVKLPPVESIHYSLANASPPFLYYLEQALDQLSPLHRLIVLMAQTFQWNSIRIAAYLRAEGTVLSEDAVERSLAEGYQSLMATLPRDICEIYQLQTHGLEG
jgi:hypothetical protein